VKRDCTRLRGSRRLSPGIERHRCVDRLSRELGTALLTEAPGERNEHPRPLLGIGCDGGLHRELDGRGRARAAQPRAEALDEHLRNGRAGHDPCIDAQRPRLYARAVSKRSFSTFWGTRVG
jgi:hypothetical protein